MYISPGKQPFHLRVPYQVSIHVAVRHQVQFKPGQGYNTIRHRRYDDIVAPRTDSYSYSYSYSEAQLQPDVYPVCSIPSLRHAVHARV